MHHVCTFGKVVCLVLFIVIAVWECFGHVQQPNCLTLPILGHEWNC